MNESYVLNLGFKTDAGKIYAMSVSGANPSVTEAEIIAAMDAVVSSDAIIHKNGSPVSAYSAKLVKTETVPINVLN